MSEQALKAGFQVLDLEEIDRIALNEAKEALESPYKFKKQIKHVAVIGTGPSGLPSARHLKEAGFCVRVFERNSSVGGVWVYSESTVPKPKMPTSRITRDVEHKAWEVKEGEPQKQLYEMTPEIKNLMLRKCPPSACYRDLYNNISTSLFAYPDFPFPENTPDWCPHQVTQAYFESYAHHYDLMPLIEFDTSVDLVTKQQDRWELTLSKYDVYTSGIVRETRWKESFDAVVIATGPHQDPYVPDFKDFIAYNKMHPDRSMHSIQYRRPEDFVGKHVLLIGGSISAVDIARSLEGFSTTTTMAIKGPFESPFPIYNIVRSTIPRSVSIKPNVATFSNEKGEIDGTILFEDDTVLDDVDQVIFCTGFNTRLQFLDGLVIPKDAEQVAIVPPRPLYDDVPESHVVLGPKFPLNVYREVFLMSDPTLAFVGLPPITSLPSHFDTQAISVARVWSGQALLPTTEHMQQFASDFNPGISLQEIFNADRKRRQPFLTWLNYHAEKIHPELPTLENYPADHEERGNRAIDQWIAFSNETFKKTRERISKHQL